MANFRFLVINGLIIESAASPTPLSKGGERIRVVLPFFPRPALP